ncbi:MAG: cytochrome c maturation protein CcmE, partial [Chloroflexota bacterium]
LVYEFTITYQGESIPIYYKGVLPSGFKEDMDVTIDGKLGPSGVFKATQVLTKCPSKYVPEKSTNEGKGA